MNNHTILATMQDRPGVLNKVAMLFRRKMYNIETLTVCESIDPEISRMTITISAEDPTKVNQAIKQIEKIPEVISAKDLDREKSFWREIALLKCTLKESKIEYLKNNYKYEILAEEEEYLILQIAGTVGRIDAFIGEIGLGNIKEIARSGVTAIEG